MCFLAPKWAQQQGYSAFTRKRVISFFWFLAWSYIIVKGNWWQIPFFLENFQFWDPIRKVNMFKPPNSNILKIFPFTGCLQPRRSHFLKIKVHFHWLKMSQCSRNNSKNNNNNNNNNNKQQQRQQQTITTIKTTTTTTTAAITTTTITTINGLISELIQTIL